MLSFELVIRPPDIVVVSYIVSKRQELWSTNGFKLDHPPSEHFAFLLIAGLHTRTSYASRAKISEVRNKKDWVVFYFLMG